MDFPIHIDAISMELSIMYFKRSRVECSKYWCMIIPGGCFNPCKQCRPWWNAALCCISSGSVLFAKVPIQWFPVHKGLRVYFLKVSNGAKIRNRYNQVPHLTQDTNGRHHKRGPNEGQEVSPFPAGDHKAHINRHAQNIANTRQNKNIKDPQKKYRLGTVSKIFYWRV